MPPTAPYILRLRSDWTEGIFSEIYVQDPRARVGVVVDVYHVFWDPDLYSQIARASGHILGFHVNDWVVPTRDPLLERGMMGDGVIELRRIRAAVDDTGYAGPIEVEIFNPEIWSRPGDKILATMKERYAALV